MVPIDLPTVVLYPFSLDLVLGLMVSTYLVHF